MAYKLGSVLIGFGLALAASGVAVAQTTAEHPAPAASQAERTAAEQREIPWYERYSVSSNPVLRFSTGSGEILAPGALSSGRFGLSVASRSGDAVPLQRTDEASVTATYRLSPTFQLRGKLSVAEQPQLQAGSPGSADSSVKIESVFKF